MNALQSCLERHHAQVALALVLDEELGTLHGLAWADFVLLDALASAGGTLPSRELARRVSVTPARLVLQLLPLEKTGLVARTQVPGGGREVTLRGNGARLLAEARDTAAEVCARPPAAAARVGAFATTLVAAS